MFGSSLSDDDDIFEKFLEDSKRLKKSCDTKEELTAKVKKKQVIAKKKGVRRPRKKLLQNDSSMPAKKYLEVKKGVVKNKITDNIKELELEEKIEDLTMAQEDKKMLTPRKARYKRRLSVVDAQVRESFLEEGLDKEDVQMFKLAMARLRDEEDSAVENTSWAHYPCYILLYCNVDWEFYVVRGRY